MSRVGPAAVTAAGLGISLWLAYLDYRRRLPQPEPPRAPRYGARLLGGGLGLTALGLGIRMVSGTDEGWAALAAYAAALAGMALVAVWFTAVSAGPSDAKGREGGKKAGD